MKNQFIKKLIFLLFISLNAVAQDGKFSFTISSPVSTSAGVFKNDSILIRTLWNNVDYKAGSYTKYWDGKDDQGIAIASPSSNYKIKILTNNVQYTWQGTIGNSSTNMTGNSKHRGYNECIKGLALGTTYGYFCTGYSEGSSSIGKFDISTPNVKIPLYPTASITGDVSYVATDGTNVYWGIFDAYSSNNSFVLGTKVSDDTEIPFTTGSSYTVTYGNTYSNVISKSNQNNSQISGLAVQKTGNYLFVARKNLNQLQVINKTTGALVQTLSYTTPKSLCIDRSDNLWMVSGSNTVAKYAVNSNGILSSAEFSLSGLYDPLAIQVSYDGTLISVADGGVSQQLKFYNNSTGTPTNTLGVSGGYSTDVNVNNNKFYFNDLRAPLLPCIAYEADGSFWIGDPGNSRLQHYNSGRTYLDRIMFLGSTYSTWADRNNITRVWNGYQEFAVDYSVQTLTGSTGWSLTKNWGASVKSNYDDFTKLKFQTTLSNGRTYAMIRNGDNFEIVELPATGTMRFTGILLSYAKILCSDGSLQDYSMSGSTATYVRYPITGFDGLNNPVWSGTAEILATALSDNITGNPVCTPNNQVFSSTNKIALFNYGSSLDAYGKIFMSGNHLGLMQKGANNTYLFQTEKSTHRNYGGEYPKAGWFDEGNGVNSYAGGNVNIVDRNIITSYHGEFWKASQTNKYNHYYDNGLAIGQFGTTRPEVGFSNHAAAKMAGNALSPVVVKDANGDLYLYHGDESDHSGIHRWKISGLNTIAEQVITIPYPSAYAETASGFEDLMVGLPFNATLKNNTNGWTRNPATDVESGGDHYTVNTSMLKYDNDKTTDLYMTFAQAGAATYNLSRDLGNNIVNTSWKISGNVTFNYMANGLGNNAYMEVLDVNGKVLTTMYAINDYSNPIRVFGNTVPVLASTLPVSIGSTNSFDITLNNGVVNFTYGGYAFTPTTISDATGNWKTPKTFRIRFTSKPGWPDYGISYDVSDLKFYKDYQAVADPINQPPVSNAGNNVVITLPTNNTTLTGTGTDADGTISSYVWVKLSGPSTGTISTPNSAITTLTNLVQGIYQYELSVTDNDGAIGKSKVQVNVNVNSTVNQSPVSDAGANISVTLPTTTTTLTGSGTDTDGTIASYAWSKLSGPSAGTIVSPNASSTVVDNLSQGVYQYKLTVTDNVGAVSNDTVQVTENAATVINLLPAVNPANTVNGLDYKYYEGTWDVVPAFASLNAIKTGTTTNFDISLANRSINYGFNFTGYINVPSDGQYKFYTSSDDGSNLYIDNVLTVSNDGLHDVVEKSGTIGLKAGKHAISGLFFQQTGGQVFAVNYEGMGIAKQAIPATALYRIAPNAAPVANAGVAQTIALPTSSVTLSGTGTDTDGTISGYAWAKLSGPATGTIAIANAYNTTVNNLTQGVYQYELTVTDNNGATAKSTVQVTVNAAPVINLLPAVNPANTVNGLDYKYYEGTWEVLPAFATLKAIKTGTATNFDISLANRSINYGFNFTGYINVPSDGQYKFYTSSDDGSNLYIDNVLAVSNDGLHDVIEKSGTIGLKAGKHAISGLYFQQTGGQVFAVNYEGMGIAKQAIPATALYRIAPNAAPVANAGVAQTIALPTSSVTLSGTGTDTDGTISGYAWAKLSGPATGTIRAANASATTVNNLTQGVYQYELTVTDNNGATAKSTVQVTVNAAPVINLLPAVNPANTVNGLDYKYYEGTWDVLPAFASLKAIKTGTATNFDISLANRSINYGFNFTGYINVPSDGQYKFYTSSDDGSNLYIDNVLAVSNDGLHDVIEKSGTIGLKSGKHAISGLFFQQTGGQVFAVSYEGMGITKQAIPASALYRVSTPVVGSVIKMGNTSNGFTVYPNPVKDIANLNITTIAFNSKVSISVSDISGKVVKNMELVTIGNQTLSPFDLSNLRTGYYIITVRFADGQILSSKILKNGGK